MELAEYLLCIAARHCKARGDYEAELRYNRSPLSKKNQAPPYESEMSLVTEVIGSVRGKPRCLRKISLPGIAALAYIMQAKIRNRHSVQAYEIVNQMICDPEFTIEYLNAIGELRDADWVRLIEIPGHSFTDQPPLCWLKAYLELGDTFHKEIGATSHHSNAFPSNDSLLDATYAYLQSMIHSEYDHFKVSSTDADLATLRPEGWYRRIGLRIHSSTVKLPAARAIEKYALSTFQFLTLVGLLGLQDKELDYEFNDLFQTTRLFSKGRACRKLMQEHLFGENSTLIRQQLLEGIHGAFGEEVRLTQTGIRALIGSNRGRCSSQELRRSVRKNTLFDLEEPKLDPDSVKLSVPVMEAIRAIIFSESRAGRQVRKTWQDSLPSAWGAPTGSTVLLYGPPGTGKTLTAQFLASELKLPLLKIDSSRILSCWVGESEQNVRRIFDDYSSLQEEWGKAPVLLLNEADQLLGSREVGKDSVDRMNNNMQNLFLEGLEKFTGLLVATTNRRDLLDQAFSRRFLFKLELLPPGRDLRMELWRKHLPLNRLDANVDIAQLADLRLTGGEIRVVVERTVRLLAFRGVTTIDGNTLMSIAREELANSFKRNGCTIGFSRENLS